MVWNTQQNWVNAGENKEYIHLVIFGLLPSITESGKIETLRH